jgi:hypothetical protein
MLAQRAAYLRGIPSLGNGRIDCSKNILENQSSYVHWFLTPFLCPPLGLRYGMHGFNQRSSSTQVGSATDPKANRPLSPHLTIYQPQLTWYMSGLHRITGVYISGCTTINGSQSQLF